MVRRALRLIALAAAVMAAASACRCILDPKDCALLTFKCLEVNAPADAGVSSP